MIRAVKEESKRALFKLESDYDYHAFVTSIGAYEMSGAAVIEFYRGRGNAENFLKEIKNGLDLHHYPCQQLTANKAYGLIGAISYNLMRFISLLDNIKKPKFAKAIRFHFVHLPMQVLRHARQVIFRYGEHHYNGNVKSFSLKSTSTLYNICSSRIFSKSPV
ncbi:MAG: transposase [Oligoflexales bacterium]|nr:transposase [Oligoflexales bacterium]